MKKHNHCYGWICLVIGGLIVSGCQSGSLHKVTGAVALKQERQAGTLPTRAPSIVYVTEFELGAENFQADQRVHGLLPGLLRQRPAFSLGENLPKPLGGGDPATKAREIVKEMSQALVKSLSEKGMPALPMESAAAVLPREGWMVSGVFTEVDEGNRIKRAAIGFGRGATQMDVQVGVSDLAGQNPRAPFVLFGTGKDAGMIPGAVVTMNPYVAAARFVMEKNATHKDIQKTADQIAAEILKFKDRITQEGPK